MISECNILCTICARGGSRGVEDKNIRPLIGKPLIAYTIEQALRWGRATDVVVSTDSEKIAEVAKRYGALVPFKRPKNLATDSIAKLPSIRHALIKSEKSLQKKYDIIVDLDATSPIRRVADLDNCLKIFDEKKAETLFSVVRAHKNPYFNMVERKKDGFAKLCKEYALDKIARRQDAPEVFDMNASIYLYRRDFLLNPNSTLPFSDKTAIYIMEDISAFDIDKEIDFKFAEFLIKEGVWKNEI